MNNKRQGPPLNSNPKRQFSTPPPLNNIPKLMDVYTHQSGNSFGKTNFSTPPPPVPIAYPQIAIPAYGMYSEQWAYNNNSWTSQQLPPLPQDNERPPPPPPEDSKNPENSTSLLNVKSFASLQNIPGTSKRAKKRQKAAQRAAETAAMQADNNDVVPTLNKKSKRKPMATRYTVPKEWNKEEAQKALEVEMEYSRKKLTPIIIIKFPDPHIDGDVVKKFHPQINMVHFQQPCTPRYCFAQLNPNADIDAVIEEVSKIKFGDGYLSAERKHQSAEKNNVEAEEIDPYTLYVGNIPTNLSTACVKQEFPKALRIDVGFAQKMKYTRYAFIRYASVDDAIEAYKNTYNKTFANRSVIVRFRRTKGTVGMSGEQPPSNKEKPQNVDEKVVDLETNNQHELELEHDHDHEQEHENETAEENYEEVPESEKSKGYETDNDLEFSLDKVKQEPRDEFDESPMDVTTDEVNHSVELNVANVKQEPLDENIMIKIERRTPTIEDDEEGINDLDDDDENSKSKITESLLNETWDKGKSNEESHPEMLPIVMRIKKEKSEELESLEVDPSSIPF